MCGILAIATVCGTALPIGDAEAMRMRDVMAHRGPDGAGVWWSADRSVCLGHRRLAVVGLGHAADQPMGGSGIRDPGSGIRGREESIRHRAPGTSGGGREEASGHQTSGIRSETITLVYNGEWYDEPRARRGMVGRGVSFATSCDTETLLRALGERGDAALDSLRGMYALAWHDAARHTLTIARDPLGIKPVYWARVVWRGVDEVVVASEPTVLLAHQGISAEPDWPTVSAYISHSRAVLGDRSMFRGIHALLPGEVIEFRLDGERIMERRRVIPLLSDDAGDDGAMDDDHAAGVLRRSLRSSVFRHLRADVPSCALLSGGLDSTVLVAIARERMPGLRTFAAGAAAEGDDAERTRLDRADDDLSVAVRVAEEFGLSHERAVLDGAAWTAGWLDMVDRLGVPTSTPNEVAIHAVAQRLRAAGCVVTLSGEGADELLLGYGGPLQAIKAGVADGRVLRDPAGFAMELSTWMSGEHKAMLLREGFWRAVDADVPRRIAFERALEETANWFGARSGGGREGNEAAFANQAGALARLNLNALLRRLDTATMLASVEGRTPFADRFVARTALRMRSGLHYAGGASCAMQTKRVLRRAFADEVPGLVMRRAKASFPVPFQRWLAEAGVSSMVRGSGFLRSVYQDEAIELVARDPLGQWMLAWPMANLAAWARRWGWEDGVCEGTRDAAAVCG